MNSFTPLYQVRLLALLCLDQEFFLQINPVLEENYFTTYVGKCLHKIISVYYDVYKRLPTRTVIETELTDVSVEILPEEQPLLQEFLALLTSGQIPEKDYIKETSSKFVKSRLLRFTLNERTEDIDSGDIDSVISALKNVQQNSQLIQAGKEDKYLFSLRNLREIYEGGINMKTGLGLIDNFVGGLNQKELTLLLSDTNLGKSTLLCYIGGQLLRQSRKVLHITLEMSFARTLARYFTTLAEIENNITYSNIFQFQPREHVFNYILGLREKYESYLFVEEIPTGKGTIADLYRLVSRWSPEVLIVDYLDLIRPVKKRDVKRFELADLTIALRGLAVETGVAVLSATQTSRQAIHRRIVGKEFVSEDYEKMRVSDVVVGMGQTLEDALKSEVVLFLTKSRNTEKNKAERYFIDFNRMRFNLLRSEVLSVPS